MAEQDLKGRMLIGKLAGLALVIVGVLLAASGYRGGSPGYMAAGIALLVIGLIVLVRKILTRNQIG
ncbi:MAG: hypothetical protein ABWZ57_05060 [Mesorhizobium sp.]|jgi:hypothetical protein